MKNSELHHLMQKSVQVRKNCMISTMNGQFQLELPIFEKRKNMNIKVYLGANEGNNPSAISLLP